MPDSFGPQGLEVEQASEITAFLVEGYTEIYAPDVNVDQNTPDGQVIGIETQIGVDLRETLAAINAGFDPDQAQGVILDQRVAINNIKRNGGTYTVQPVSITVSATVILAGLDANFNSPTATAYTVSDSLGNQFYLATTTTLMAGTTVCDFRAANVGAVSVPINTIINPVTIISGVTSVNNPSSAISVGVTQETDGALRIRRQQSTANATSGNAQGLKGKLLALTGVTEAEVYQNRGGTTDANGIPGHSIWAIVAGGAASDIGNLIYKTISDGCGMLGAQSFVVTTPSGAIFTAMWDVPTPETLFVQFTIKRTVPSFDFAIAAIKTFMAANKVYGIGEFAETSFLTAIAAAAIAAQGGGGVPVLMQISLDNATWTDYLATATLASEFTLDPANITITVV